MDLAIGLGLTEGGHALLGDGRALRSTSRRLGQEASTGIASSPTRLQLCIFKISSFERAFIISSQRAVTFMVLTVAYLVCSCPIPTSAQPRRNSRSSFRLRTADKPCSDMLTAQRLESVPCLPLRSR